MVPAHEGFDTEDVAAGKSHDRLVMKLELILRQGVLKV